MIRRILFSSSSGGCGKALVLIVTLLLLHATVTHGRIHGGDDDAHVSPQQAAEPVERFARDPCLYTNSCSSSKSSSSSSEPPLLRWASSGGGWRAMVASMAFSNVFEQAGLLSTSNASSSQFAAMSFNSGSAWFSTQFFYSQPFFQAVMSSPDALATFVQNWMEAYYQMQESSIVDFPMCADPNGFVSLLQLPLSPSDQMDFCNLLVVFGGSWADFTQAMIQAASTAYGDADFIHRPFGVTNRVAPLRTTDIYVQTSLAPMSRANMNAHSPGQNVYIGQSCGRLCPQTVLAVPLAAQFAITSNAYQLNMAIHGTQSLIAIREPAPVNLTFGEYSDFYLYPATNGSVFTELPDLNSYPRAFFRAPFGGAPTVMQVAASSSASAGTLSGAVPSLLAQTLSVNYFEASVLQLPPEQSAALLAKVASAANMIYNFPLFNDFAVCTQWPSPCVLTDGRLVDGAFSDGTNLALNIGHYQTIEQGDLSKTLKVIITSNNYALDTNVNVLSYFQTTFNGVVAPGDFIWAPATGNSGLAQTTPWRSYQIFQDYLDDSLVTSCMESVPGTNVTYCFLNATTVDNQAFGVKAGQAVELLWFKVNSGIPTIVIGRNATRTYTPQLVDLSYEIANNTYMVDLVKSFAATS